MWELFLHTSVKQWSGLFTSLITGTVHIGVFYGLVTDACMTAMTTFIVRRGTTHKVNNDNWTNIVRPGREFEEWIEIWDRDSMSDHLARGRIVWTFHLVEVERLARNCRKAMLAILGDQRLGFRVLTTSVFGWSYKSARPLTSMREDPENAKVITPNHFVLAQSFMPTLVSSVDCR